MDIAEALGAHPESDIFLGQRASEQRVKSMDLSDRKVIAFATHALVPGHRQNRGQLCPSAFLGAFYYGGRKRSSHELTFE